jgi:hypothetical protein
MFVKLRGYCGDGDEGKFSPAAGIGDGKKFGERGGERGNSIRTFPAPLTSLPTTIFHII